MIYQHRLVIARGGRLEKRHTAFQEEVLAALDDYGSVLIGAWEVWIGPEAGCAVWQLRQFDSLAAWEQHQERVRQDRELSDRRQTNLYPYNDFVDTSIIRLATGSPVLSESWPPIEDVRGTERGFIEQRIDYLQPGTSRSHNEFYFERVAPALARYDAELIGLFDTVIGQGTTNAGSHRCVELRHFPDMTSWQNWRSVQDTDPELRELVKTEWMSKIERVDTSLLRPLDYSRIR